MDYKEQILEELKKETRRRLIDENFTRLKKCLSLLSEQEIWYCPNENTVSVGNLVLHLCGNIRQWLLSGIGDEPDTRERQKEFDETGPVPVEELLAKMQNALTEVDQLLDRISPEVLVEKKKVQGFDESGMSIIWH